MALRARAARDDPPCRCLLAAAVHRVAPRGRRGRGGGAARGARRRAMRFWDSSALVPLVVAQPSSPVTDAWLAADPAPAVWTLTPVEISSAVQRLLREGAIADEIADQAE